MKELINKAKANLEAAGFEYILGCSNDGGANDGSLYTKEGVKVWVNNKTADTIVNIFND